MTTPNPFAHIHEALLICMVVPAFLGTWWAALEIIFDRS